MMIKYNGNFINPKAIVRFGGLPIDYFKNFFSIDKYAFEKTNQIIVLDRAIKLETTELIKSIYSHIKKYNPTGELKLSLINTKRNLFNNKKLSVKDNIKIYEMCQESSIVAGLKNLISNKNRKSKLQNEVENEFTSNHIDILKLIIDLSNNEDFLKGIALSSTSMYQSIVRYGEKTPNKLRTKDRKFITSLLKYLTRTVYKTSPYSYFCIQGIGEITNHSKPINNLSNIAFSRINQSILLRLIDKTEEEYIINSNVWYKNDGVTFFKRFDGPLRHSTYRNKESLISIENTGIIKYLLDLNQSPKRGGYKQWILFLKGYDENLTSTQLTEIMNQLIESNLLVKRKESFLDQYDLDCILGEATEAFDLGRRLGTATPEERVSILDNLREHVGHLNINFQDSLVNEDVLLKEKIQLQEKELSMVFKELNLLFNILPLYDGSLRKQFSFKQFLQESKTSCSDIPVLLSEFNELWEAARRQKSTNPFHLEEINELNELYVDLQKSLSTALHQRDNVVQISGDYLEKLSTRIPSSMKNNPFSALFYFQLSKSDEIYLNKIYSGFGRCFSRYANYHGGLRDSLQSNLSYYQEQFIFKLTEIKDSVGFNANLHPHLTENFINYTNSSLSIKDGQINMNDLRFEIEDGILKLKYNDTAIYPLHLGQMSSLHLPTGYRSLFSLFHFDSIDLDLSVFAMQKHIKHDNPIQKMPEVKFGGITVSREKWLLKKDYIDSLLRAVSEGVSYINLIDFFIKEELPLEFFTYPIEGIKFKTISKINDYYKPQYINLKSQYFYRLFRKISSEYPKYIVIEKVAPSHIDIKHMGSNSQTEYGIEFFRGSSGSGNSMA